jgi:hypothetical protein
MYNMMRAELCGEFDMVLTEIARDNVRSLKVQPCSVVFRTQNLLWRENIHCEEVNLNPFSS